MSAKLSRRDFVKSAAITAGAVALAACKPAATPTPAETQPTKAPEATKATEATTAPATTTECQMDWNPTFPQYKVYDPPVEVRAYFTKYEYPSPEYNELNNPAYQEVLERTYIKFVPHRTSAGEGSQDQLLADIAAGTPPDMFRAGGTLLEELIANDMIEDIKDIWEATASPLTKEKKMWPDGVWWKTVLRGDKLYGIKFCPTAHNGEGICFIRKDWLDQVGLPMPTTVEDWGNAARTFKDAGLCQFGIAANNNLVNWYHSLDMIFGAYGAMPGYWLPDGSGGLVFGTILPGVKDALAVFREWYADGLLDPDFYTYGTLDTEGHVLTEKVGIWTCPWWGHGADHTDLPNRHPEWDVAIMPYPKGPNGQHGRKADSIIGGQVVFRKGLDPIVIEALINNLNYHIDKHVNWVKYQQYGEWRNGAIFVEGFDWVFDENCEVVDGPFPPPYTYKYMTTVDFTYDSCSYPSYQMDVFNDMKPWFDMDPSELNKAQRYLLSPQAKDQIRLYSFVYETADEECIHNEYWGNPTDRMVELLPDLNKLCSEVVMNIVIGNEPLDRFDSFVEEWLEMGGAEVTQDVSDWYRETYG